MQFAQTKKDRKQGDGPESDGERSDNDDENDEDAIWKKKFNNIFIL